MPKPTKNPGPISFSGTILQSDRVTNSWAWIKFPYDLKELYGIGNLVPAIMSFDGIEYRGSIAKMGGPYPMLLIKRDILSKLGKKKGDKVLVIVTLDDKPREVVIPAELKNRLQKNPKAKELYLKLAYTHRKEFASWVESAKQAETRERRADKAIDMILAKQKSH
jgi:hypothetical protein